MYLLDTNACIDFLERRSERLIAAVDRNFGQLSVSSITAAELLVGARGSTDSKRDAEHIEMFLSGLVVHPFDLRAARKYGALIRQIGVRRNSFDRLIGVHAVTLGHTLVTRNRQDFADVPGLVVEDWTV